MNKKRIGSLVVLIIGIALIIFSLYVKNRMTGAQGEIGHITHSPFGGNKATNAVGGILEGKVAQYKPLFIGSLVAGIVLVVIGGALFMRRSSTRKR